MVAVAEHILKDSDSAGDVLLLVDASPGEGLYKPEGAHRKRTLAATDSVVGVLGVVSVDQACAGEAAFLWREEDAVHCAEESRVVRGDEEDERCDEDARVEHIAALVRLDETVDVAAVAFGHDLFIDFVTGCEPLISVRAWKATLLGKTQTTVKGNPKHDLGVNKVLFLVADFPDRHVGICQS